MLTRDIAVLNMALNAMKSRAADEIGAIGISWYQDSIEVQLSEKAMIQFAKDTNNTVVFQPRSCEEYPLSANIYIDGVRYFCLCEKEIQITESEVKKNGTD